MKLTTRDNEVVEIAEDRSAYLYAGMLVGVLLAILVSGLSFFH